jgi:lipopolysaccharide transport system ATP-binding protein
MLLHKGEMKEIGVVDKVVNTYLSGIQKHLTSQLWNDPLTAPGNEFVRIHSVNLVPDLKNPTDPIDIRTALTVKFKFWNLKRTNLTVAVQLWTQASECIFDVSSTEYDLKDGLVEGACTIPGNFLNDGSYFFSLVFVKDTSVELFNFEVEDFRENINWYGKWVGYVRPNFPVLLHQANESHSL